MIYVNKSFWKNKKVLITGHTGFKGSWLAIWLHSLGAQVIGYSLEPYTDRDNFVLSGIGDKIIDVRGDIRDGAMLQKVFDQYQPEIVFHLAAQPLVRLSYENPVETYEINVMGTLHVLEAIRHTDSVTTGIMITTDKCYENKETMTGYVETDPFGGYDPYSSSKGCDEILISSYRRSYFLNEEGSATKAIASVRAGNVIGGGDWSKDRIVPDCIRAIEARTAIQLRNPEAVRPFEHVLEPLSGYLMLAEKIWSNPKVFCSGWNFGPKEKGISRVIDVASQIRKEFGTGTIEDASHESAPHEANLLNLDITKARRVLGWEPRLSSEQSVKLTAQWYQNYKKGNVYDLCMSQIRKFEEIGDPCS